MVAGVVPPRIMCHCCFVGRLTIWLARAHSLVQWFAGWLAGRVIDGLAVNVILIFFLLSLKRNRSE